MISPSTSTLLLSSAMTRLLFNWFFARLSSVGVTPPRMARVRLSSWYPMTFPIEPAKSGCTEAAIPKRPVENGVGLQQGKTIE